MNSLRISWISGWSVPADVFLEAAQTAWPEANHSVVDPSPDALASIVASDADALGGYSFGAHLLFATSDPRPRIFLAPFLDLKLEAGLGGAVATTQIKQLRRWIQRDRAAALYDFHSRIGLSSYPPTDSLSLDDLVWGLDQMLAAPASPTHLSDSCLLLAGSRDPLLDVPTLQTCLPRLLVTDSTHAPLALLETAARLYKR